MRDRLACLTIDVEPDEPPNPNILLFDDYQRFEWFKSMLSELGASLTAFVVMKYAERYASALEEIACKIPTELALHSYSHDQSNTASSDEVRRARDAFIRLWGKAPEGYRAPYGLINGDGLRTLMDEGLMYDSSIFPTLRVDQFGYNNLRYPRVPFLFTDGARDIVEVPVAALRGCRLIYSLSFVKLLGPNVFRYLVPVFPLPEIVVIDFHPYDLYVGQLLGAALPGWKRFAHLRNATQAPEILVQMIKTLRDEGYRFTSVSEVARRWAVAASSQRVPVPQ